MNSPPQRLFGGSALAVSVALLAALLAGCTDPADRADPGAGPSTTAGQERSGAGLDATSIEGTVAEAEAILKDLDQEFQQDDNE